MKSFSNKVKSKFCITAFAFFIRGTLIKKITIKTCPLGISSSFSLSKIFKRGQAHNRCSSNSAINQDIPDANYRKVPAYQPRIFESCLEADPLMVVND